MWGGEPQYLFLLELIAHFLKIIKINNQVHFHCFVNKYFQKSDDVKFRYKITSDPLLNDVKIKLKL